MQIETFRDEYVHIPELVKIIKDNKNKDDEKLREFVIELEHLLLKSLEGKGQRYITKINQKLEDKPIVKKHIVKYANYLKYDSKDIKVVFTNMHSIILKNGTVLWLEKEKKNVTK